MRLRNGNLVAADVQFSNGGLGFRNDGKECTRRFQELGFII